MRTIKFRARVVETDLLDAGKIVYGSFVDYGETSSRGLNSFHRYWIITPDDEPNYPVDRDSVQQLIRYDANGAEVYEGDVTFDADGNEVIAELTDIAPTVILKEATA